MADAVLEQIAALKDEDWAVREEAAIALGEAQDQRAVIPLVAVLNDGDRSVREAAIGALKVMGGAAVVPLGDCLQSSDSVLQESAASILYTISDHRILDQLLEALENQNWIVRMHAAKALGRVRHARAVEFLTPLLQDKVKAVREEAVQTLGVLGDGALPQLLESLKHAEWVVRLHSVEALGKIKSPECVGPLLHVLFNDRDSAVRVDAARALGEVGDPRAVEFLLVVMKDKDIRVRAIEAVGKIGDRRAVPALIGVVVGADKPSDSRPIHGCGDRYEEEMLAAGSAVTALGLIKDEAAMPTLILALQNTIVREEAADALAAFGAPAIPLLLEVLRKERDENILYHVKEALRQLGWRPNRVKA